MDLVFCMLSFLKGTVIEKKLLQSWGKGRGTQLWDFRQVSLKKEDEGGSRSFVFHVGGRLLGLSVLPVMRLKLNPLTMSAPHERTALVTTATTGFAESHLSFRGKKGLWSLAQLMLIPFFWVYCQSKPGGSIVQSGVFFYSESITFNLKMFSKLSSEWKYLFKSSECNKKISF